MISHNKFLLNIVIICSALTYWQPITFAGIQISENFDNSTSWNLPWGAGYTNVATNATGWVVTYAKIAADATAPSQSNSCFLQGNITNYVLSPWISNGVGSVIFYSKIASVSAPNQIVVESSLSNGIWTTQGPTNNIAATTWACFTNPVFSPTNMFIRLRKLGSTNFLQVVYFDSISITYPPAAVSITNVTINPAAPMENDSITVTATLSINGSYPDTLNVTNYWKLSSSTNWTAIPMPSNQPNVFITASNIPGQKAYSAIDYFAQSVMTADGFSIIANSPTNTISIRPKTGFTSMVVTNSIIAPLTLSANYQWQGVAYVSNALSTFKFNGTSNNVNTLWGDSNQTISNQLAFGNADVGATDIILSTTNIGLHLFTFNESDFTYRIRPCVRENFETWSNQPFGTYTNLWILNNGSVTNDLAGSYSNNYATLNSNATSYLLSPLLPNGIGHISFWYRKWGSGTPSGSINIQVAPNPSSTNWTTIASITNITSTIYSFVNIPWADLNNQAVRILNNTNAGNSGVSLDEVVISAPGASVAITNVTLNPVTPLENDSITVTGMLSMNGYLDSLTATNYWKLSTSTNWIAIPMASNQPNTFITISNIPGQQSFTPIDYFVQAKPTIDGITAFVNSTTNTVIIRPRTSYTTMMITNSVIAPLTLSSTYQWQGVAYVSNTLSTFKFSGTSNGVNTLWGDSNQTVSNQLAFGNADIGAGNIILSTTNIGLYLFTFNESDFTYRIRPCVRENLETWTNQPFGTYTNLWILNNGAVTNDTAGSYSNNYATLNSNATSYLLSPLLPNGIGHISFWYRKWGSPGGASGSLYIQVAPTPSSTNWTTIASVSNISLTTYSFVNIPWADLNNQAVRILNNTNAGAPRVSLDEVVISVPGASVAITNVTLNPTLPTGNDSISVSSMLALNGYLDALSATNYWKLSSDSIWNFIPMASNQPSMLTTISPIPNQLTFAAIDYYVQATPTIDGINNLINSITNTIVIRPQSSYSSMVVTNSINAPLTLVSNNQWQGVAYVSNTPAFFKFKSTSNGVNTLWGDSNQSISNLMAYGNGDIGATDITLTTTNIGPHLFSFNESDLTYSIRACVRENFETWTNQSFGTYTNQSQWILTNGAVTNDATGAYSGRYAILNSNTTSYLLSPLLTNGIGNISFWYRKTGSASASSGNLSIQVAPTPASTNWVTIASLTNITATYYAFTSIPWADLNNQAVRIVNTTNSGSALISLDEVVIAAPGAAVYAANLTNTPSSPGSLDSVNIAIDLTPNAWATNPTNVVVWYRGNTNLLFESLPMTQTNGYHYTTTSGIPPSVGTVQYFVSYGYSGVFGVSPVFYPTSGTNQPYSYTSTNTLINYRYEPFDSTNSWGPLPWGPYTNTATNAITRWVISNATIKPDALAPSQPYAGLLQGGKTAFVASPLLTNGIGSVVFVSKLAQAVAPNQVVVESSASGIGDWTIQGPTNSLSTTNWGSFTNTILVSTNVYIRLRQLVTNNSSVVYLDSISCTPYPAFVAITNINLNPGYPAVGQSVMASCDVLSQNPNYPAFSITPTFYWSPYIGLTNSIPMVNTSGSTYTTTYPFLLTNVTRDVPVTYWVSSRFAGYHAIPADDLSPRSSVTNSFILHAYSSSYSNIAANINGINTLGRLVTNGLWQSIISGSAGSTNFTLAGLGFSIGSGYSTNNLTFGNSNNWQTTIPLADTVAGTNPIPANLTNGQFVVRYDEATGLYLVQRCVWQDFDKPGEGDGTSYKQSTLSSTSGGAQQNFDLWTTNITRSRSENFNGDPWTNYTSGYVSGVGGGTAFFIYSGIVVNVSGSYVLQTASNVNPTAISDSFIVQGSHMGENPLRGIGQVSYTFAATRTNPPAVPAKIGVYIYDTNFYPEPAIGDTTYMTFKTVDSWRNVTPVNVTSNITSTINTNVTVDVNTNRVQDVFFADIEGTQSLQFASVSISEWYAEAQQTNSDGWVGAEYWIESSLDTNRANVCRLDVTRASNPTNQFLRSPRISGGIKYIEFYYAGVPSLSQKPPTNITVNFTVELTDNPSVWTNTLDSITTNFLNNTAGTNYYRYFRSLQTPQGGLYVRIRNTTPKPGALLLDNINIPGYATTNDWYINNLAIDYKDQTFPPWPRQYYRGAGYLNNTRVGSSLSTNNNEFPATNTFPQIRTPLLAGGIGEISFRYRNWATSAPLYPAKLVVQAAPYLTSSTNENDWTTTIATITNIVNTNDYLYFSISLYDTSNRYVRIYNDDTYTSNVGRVCLDDILVTAPLAASLSLSNLVISPTIPIYTNTVDVSVDVYNLFLSPNITGLTTYYSTSSSYTGLSSVATSSLPMSCIASNISGPNKWYRYKTSSPIPTQSSDTFVKYFVKAAFTGLLSQATSPSACQSFGIYPSWYAPMDKVYGSNFAYYIVYSCPTGSVWINELNYADYANGDYVFTNELIELAGTAGNNIQSWKLEIYDQNFDSNSCYQAYLITNNSTLPNNLNGLGFWVIGDQGVANHSQLLTQFLPGSPYPDENLPYSGYMILTRKTGIYEDRIRFGSLSSPTNGYTYAGDDPLSAVDSLGMTGTGTVKSAFSWPGSTIPCTPGSVNFGQTIAGSSQNAPPTVIILSFWLDTNVWITCTTTNNWYPVPWYTTNLMVSNSWSNVTTFTSSTASNNCTMSFTKPTGATPYYYKVLETNGP